MNRWDAYVEDPGTSREQRELRRIGRDNRMVITVERGPFDSSADLSEEYQDAYTAEWFPIADAPVSCGLRTDLPRKQRIHDYVSLGIDISNKGELGIVEVIVFACSVCGRDWR